MAWNRPGKDKEEVSRLRGGILRGTAAGAGVVVAAVAIGLWLWPNDKNEVKETAPKKASVIREATPSIPKAKAAPKAAVVDETSEQEKPKELPPQKLGEVRNGYVLLGSGLHKVKGEVTNNCSLTKGKYEIFRHSSENTIAALLSLRAGDVLIGEPDYQGSFAENFRQSLQEPIKIEETDTPEQVELKHAVIEAKEELRKAMNRGEDIEKIIIAARRECQELARAKQIMMADVYDFVDKEAVTKDDVETYVEAANKLLEAKGIAPIERSTLVDIKLRHKLDDYDHETEEEAKEDK